MSRLGRYLRRIWPFGGGGDATDEKDEDGDGSVWDAIPSWQYEGRFAEAGGITRGEQERALRDIQEQAEGEDPVNRE